MPSETPRRGSWPILFQQAAQPAFILSSTKRIRFVNAAWETLTGIAASEALGHACLRKGPTGDVYRALAPTAEANAGQVTTVRRAVPPKSLGPPWWDVTFVPLKSADGIGGYLGVIAVVPADPAGVKATVPVEAAAVREKHNRTFTLDWISGTGSQAERFVNQVRHAAQSNAPVWLTGEAGCGKETVARIIHQTGPLRNKAFFGVDCAAIPWFHLEGILSGRGTFGESGKLGTLCLKDPGSLNQDAQRHLANWLQGPGAKTRVICTSTKSANGKDERLIAEFSTLFSVIELIVPPLRDRLYDLPRIVDRLLTRYPMANGDMRKIQPDALAVLANYTWPGNDRELADVLGDLEGDGPIKADQLPRWLREKAALTAMPPPKAEAGPKLDDVLADVEKRLLAVALKTMNGNATKAAEWRRGY